MALKLPIIGDSYTAQSPVDFWRKWLTGGPIKGMNHGASLYHSFGGYGNHGKAVMSSYIINGIFHDIFINGLFKIIDDGAVWGDLTIWFAIQGMPVALQKSYYKGKAKRKAEKELDRLVEKYSSDKPKEIISELNLKLSDLGRLRLRGNIKNYSSQRKEAIKRLSSSSRKYLKEALSERKNKKYLFPDVIRKPINTVLTWAYILGSFCAVNEGLRWLYSNF